MCNKVKGGKISEGIFVFVLLSSKAEWLVKLAKGKRQNNSVELASFDSTIYIGFTVSIVYAHCDLKSWNVQGVIWIAKTWIHWSLLIQELTKL